MPLARMVLLAILLFFTVPVTVSSVILAIMAPFALVIWLPVLLIGLTVDAGIGYYLYRDFRRKKNDRREYYPMSI